MGSFGELGARAYYGAELGPITAGGAPGGSRLGVHSGAQTAGWRVAVAGLVMGHIGHRPDRAAAAWVRGFGVVSVCASENAARLQRGRPGEGCTRAIRVRASHRGAIFMVVRPHMCTESCCQLGYAVICAH